MTKENNIIYIDFIGRKRIEPPRPAKVKTVFGVPYRWFDDGSPEYVDTYIHHKETDLGPEYLKNTTINITDS